MSDIIKVGNNVRLKMWGNDCYVLITAVGKYNFLGEKVECGGSTHKYVLGLEVSYPIITETGWQLYKPGLEVSYPIITETGWQLYKPEEEKKYLWAYWQKGSNKTIVHISRVFLTETQAKHDFGDRLIRKYGESL